MDRLITGKQIQKLVGFKPSNEKIYQTAFIHKSGVRDVKMKSNERLEFIGDSVLNMIVATYLYGKYPDENEGFLTRVRTKIVCTKGLAKLGGILNLGDYVIMSKLNLSNNHNRSLRILEDTFEALIGAIYLDKGLKECISFISNLIEKHLDFDEVVVDTNYKALILRHAHCNGWGEPKYDVSSEQGPDHAKIYTVKLIIDGNTISEGFSTSKKDAEQNAAHRTLKLLLVI